ncbi:hypothetical protein QUF80_14755 [Desulfococcaceae bacterium HSG8]|nr:hypothetical protein [Desulfococcaceae bacterium HSG8]
MKNYLFQKVCFFRKLNICLFVLTLFLSLFFFQNKELRCATYEADYVPWSGYWWPTIHGGLATGRDYQGHPSPLEKYDYVTSGTYDGPAARYGKEHYYDPEAVFWAGQCFSWAAASVLEEEPVHKGVYKGVPFYVGDKKALLTVAYNGTLFNRYPIDSPAEFHRLLEDFIARQKTPVIMDLGTHGEIWNYPVFKYETDYVIEGNISHYTTSIYYVRDEVTPNYIGAQVEKNIYQYYFVLDEDGNITESGWEGDYAEYPPVNASEPFGTEPLNTGVTYEQIKEIVNTDDDSYEENDISEDARPLSTGHYMLAAADSDFFKTDMKQGDTLDIRITPDAQSDDTLKTYLRTYTPDGQMTEEIFGSGEYVISASAGDGTYFFEIGLPEWAREMFYNLFLHKNLAYQVMYPVHPAGSWYSGLSMLIPDRSSEGSGRAIISLTDRDGFPRRSYKGYPRTSHLWGTLSESFGLPPSTGNEYVRIDSDVPFMGIQVAASSNELMSGANFIPIDEASATLFFPRFENMGWIGGWQTNFGVINLGGQAEEISREAYGPDGNFLASDTIELAAGQKTEDETLGILVSDGRTMSVSATSDTECLTGYIKFFNGSGGMAMVPLNTADRLESLVVPHVASDDAWWTNITVMNTGDEESDIVFSAYNAEGNQIDTSEHMLKAKQNFVGDVSDIFPDTGDIASVKIDSLNSEPLSGILLYGTYNGLQLAGLSLRSAASSLYLPHIACMDSWWTGIGLINVGDAGTDVLFSLFDGKGEALGSTTKFMNPNQQLSTTLRGLFGEDTPRTARYVKIESLGDQPLSGVYLIGSDDGLRLMGDVLDR